MTGPAGPYANGEAVMADGIGLALGAMMFYGLTDWVYKRAAANGVPAHHFLLLQALFFAPGIFLYPGHARRVGHE